MRPAIVSVVEREEAVAFAATEYATVPLPLPEAPDVIVTHDAALEAVQEHAAGALTVAEPVVAAAPTALAVGEIA